MSEEIKKNVDVENTETKEVDTETHKEKNEEKKSTPSVQELLVELAKVKRAQEKAASEAAAYKKKYNATLSEKEQASIEEAEKEAEKEQKFQELLRENQINKLEKSYLSMNYTADEAERMAIAEADGDLEAKLKVMKEADERKRKEYEAEWQKTIPQINAGVSGENAGVTKEDFAKMGYSERKALKDKYPETYKHFIHGGR